MKTTTTFDKIRKLIPNTSVELFKQIPEKRNEIRKLRKKQQLEKLNNLFVIQGAGGSSKTYSILQLLIIFCLNPDHKLHISIVGKTLPFLRKGVVKDFLTILKNEGLYNENNYNSTNHTYKLYNCTIEFFGCDDESKIRGARRDILFINEANSISKDVFTQLYIRTSEMTFLDYNPSHLTYIKDLIKEDNSNFTKLTYLDNEFLPEPIVDYYDECIEKVNNGTADNSLINFVTVFVYGEEGQLDGAVYTYEVIDSLPDDAIYIGGGLDFGFRDPNAIVKVWTSGANDIIVQQSLYKGNILNSEIANHIIKDNELANGIIIGDSARPEIISELVRSYKLKVKAVVKGAGSILNGINIVQQYNIKVIKEGSDDLINELNTYLWDDSDKSAEPKAVGIDHLLDAFRYLVMTMLKKSRNNNGRNFRSFKWI